MDGSAGKSLFDLRIAVLAFAQIASDSCRLREARKLVAKVDPSTAISFMGSTSGVYENGIYKPVEVIDEVYACPAPGEAGSRRDLTQDRDRRSGEG